MLRRIGPLVLLTTLAWACTPPPTTTLAPPLIEKAGRVTSVTQGNDNVAYVFADGTPFQFSTRDRRVLTLTPSGDFVILGVDGAGPFVGAYMTQDGLPADCYVDNSAGVDRGPYIELRGVLWRKAAGFAPAEAITVNNPYPQLTRFCFNELGEVSQTIWP